MWHTHNVIKNTITIKWFVELGSDIEKFKNDDKTPHYSSLQSCKSGRALRTEDW